MKSLFTPLSKLAVTCAFVVTGASAAVAAEAATPKKMNVLFIAADDLRPELGCYGNTRVISPRFDKLADEGFLFRRAYCQQALCAPSRASVLTGCYPDTTRVFDLSTPLATSRPGLQTLPQTFKNAGYETVSLGKIYHHGSKDDAQGWSEDPWTPKGPWVGQHYAGEKARAIFQREMDLSKEDGRRVIGPPVDMADVPDTGLPDGVIADKAITELQRLKDKPFFLAVGFAKPHLPFTAPKKYWDLYSRDQISVSDVRNWPVDMPALAAMSSGELRQYIGVPKKDNLPDEQAKELIHGYLACVSYVDAQLGRVLDEVDRLGLRDNTIIVVWGDHGYKLSEYSAWCKHSNFEIDTHSPLIVRTPQISGGKKLDQLVEFVDMYPTLTELCGINAPSTVEGTSFVPLMRDPSRQWKSAAFSQYPRENGSMGYTMRTDRYRFTEWVKDGKVIARELYDHQTADLDLVNLAGRAEYAPLVEQLSAERQAGWQGARPKQ